MKITGDQQLIKKMNKTIVLDTIRHHQPLSRTDIASSIGLNKATVSSLVLELIHSQLVTEIGPGESSGGRKPTLLLFNSNAGYAIGIDIRVHHLLMVLVNLEGTVIEETTMPITSTEPEELISEMANYIKLLSEKASPSPYGIIGIGIGVPGLVDENRHVVSTPNLGWDNISLQATLEKYINYPIYIDNEANAGAVGERLYGAGLESSNLIYLSIGVGIGSGIIVDGVLYRGTSNFSGEVGHMTVTEEGPLCRCGNHGCWETLASEKALLDQAAKALSKPNIILEDLITLAKSGDQTALHLLEGVGTHLGVGLANLVNILNPELIIIGSRLSLAGNLLEEPMLQTIEKRSLSYHRKKSGVTFAKLGLRSTALGAASMPITAFLNEPDRHLADID
ncbi:N-acetylglucosamine repressor [compost metagenome]